MSFFSKAWKAVRGVVGSVVSSTVPVVGGAIGGLISGSPKGAPSVAQLPRLPAPSRTNGGGFGAVLPGAGTVLAGLGGAAAGAGLSSMMGGQQQPRRRRRRRGISAAELKNHARVERFLNKNFKCKSGGTRRSYLRKSR